MNRTRCGSADLIRLLACAGDAEFDRLARAFGYSPGPEAESVANLALAGLPLPSPMLTASGGPATEPDIKASPLLETPFWYLASLEPVGDDIARRISRADDGPTELPPWLTDPVRQPEPAELAAWRELVPVLRGSLAAPAETRMPDVAKIVGQICSARACSRLPKRKRRRWGQSVTVIEDRSDRLIPYWQDQARVAACLSRLYPRQMFRHGLIWEGLDSPLPADPDATRGGFWPPQEGGSVVVLGDLGGLAADGGDLARHWAGWGAQLRDLGGRGLALTPVPAAAHAPAVGAVWDILAWERSLGFFGQAALGELALQLLSALSLASRIEPGLLREVRLRLGLPAAVESLVWQSAGLSSRSSVAATLRADAAQSLRERFQALPADTQRSVLQSLHRWRGGLPREVWFAEIQGLPKPLRERLPYAEDAESADGYFAALGRRLHGTGGTAAPAGLLAWYRFVAPRLRPGHENDGELGVHFQRLYRAAFAESRHAPGLPGYDPALVGPDDGKPPRRYRIDQFAGELAISPFDPLQVSAACYSPLAIVASVSGEIKIEPQTDSVFETESVSNDFWETGEPPPWADDWGRDEHGAWVTFSVMGKDGLRASQKMRWIEPGSFLMGSPETEAERFGNEGPQHEVHIQRGYWLFDTACTQALWQSVMNSNPSRYKGANRPVEYVSWYDAQQFMLALNQRLPGLDLGLPSETQWEYACRAGTQTPFSFGGNITPEQVNYNGTLPYAGGERAKYRQETVPVKNLPVNSWGLYEMHGNVWEWVQDEWHVDYTNAPMDGRVWDIVKNPQGMARAIDRVLRGGSWRNSARGCRSAFRHHGQPDDRDGSLGFRARVQGREPSQQAAGRGKADAERSVASLPKPRPAERVDRSHAPRLEVGRNKPAPAGVSGKQAGGLPETVVARPYSGLQHGPQRERTGVPPLEKGGLGGISQDEGQSRLLRLDTATKASTPLPQCPAFAILTDRERLLVRQTQKPEWADAMGRDRFGLWADIAVGAKLGQPVIQRLRWIPPGQFMMGSPENEQGHYNDESPQHPVTIRLGYWLFETPCTQALWEAVMHSNPSNFKSPLRPVEQVSWDDAKTFLQRINEKYPGLALALPNEAQWEYACRAGTETALYTGGIKILGERNAPALDAIAWYGGNSGEGYELPEGYDSSGWDEMQYRNPKSGTREVGQKQPNPWGLYDMLGNVWEWVEDPWHPNYKGATMDGSLWESDRNPFPLGEGRVRDTGAARVLRGGSWGSHARDCRSAYRDYYQSDSRDYGIGFRCARVQS